MSEVAAKKRKKPNKKKSAPPGTGSSNFEAMLASGKITKSKFPKRQKRKKITPDTVPDFVGKRTKLDVVALDCEMYGAGEDGAVSVLARATVVDFQGRVIYDQKCNPQTFITDFRTRFHGQSGKDLYDALPFKTVREQVMKILGDKVCVGHDLRHDFKALEIVHPKHLIRDTAYYKPLRPEGQKRKPSLKNLSKRILGTVIQTGAHDSAQDAIAALEIYKLHQDEWERSKKKKRNLEKKAKKK